MDYSPSALKAPFPYFGGKSRIANEIWKRFATVDNYIEPFFGSGAVLLANPEKPKSETICDKDHFVANFWRAVRADPEGVADSADNPVIEADLYARHIWLVTEGIERLKPLEKDHIFYDSYVAGLWLWGACCWIGSGWCSGLGPWTVEAGEWVKGNRGQGINKKRPHLGNRGRGINKQIPHLSRRGQGINQQIPHLSRRGKFILDWIEKLSARLRDVRVTCGDWTRILGPSVTTRLGKTAIFLDPPYSANANRKANLYRVDDLDVAHAAAKWSIAHGDDPETLIAFCGFDGEHQFPKSWEKLGWKRPGGFASQGSEQGRENCGRECIWFSPNCQRAE